MKRTRLKLTCRAIFLMVLLVFTIVYALTLYHHTKAYGNYIQEINESYPPQVIPFVDPYPIWAWHGGGLYLLAGGVLIALYVVFVASFTHALGQQT